MISMLFQFYNSLTLFRQLQVISNIKAQILAPDVLLIGLSEGV